MTFINGILILVNFYNYSYSQESDCIDSIYRNSKSDESYQDLYSGKFLIKNTQWKNGFVIMDSGDTLIGEVRLYKRGIHIGFRNQSIDKKIRADKYISFKYGDRFFVSKNFTGYPANLELIEKGKLCLYAFEQYVAYPGFTVNDVFISFYIEKGKKVYGPFNLDWTDNVGKKSWLNDCFGDCQSLILIIQYKTLKFQDLLKACKAYNCWYQNTFANTSP